jgi:hypothetical protein
MYARSSPYGLVSWPERFTILCFAAALTVASFVGPSATLYRMRALPPIVYLMQNRPPFMHGILIEEYTSSPGERQKGPPLLYPAGLTIGTKINGWVDVACKVS